ncbi:hypothetical protein BSKO_06834 [Bryopsis sp. KO-2023]|nr:hypothetical protein BSKO_06834 [Bryopsis sp. KO-2023]
MDTVLRYESHPDRCLRLWLFTDVENAKEVREKLLKAEIAPEFAFLNASLIPDIFVVHLASCKALWSDCAGSRRTKSLHAELVVNVAASKHISNSLTRFGISDDTKHLMVARFDGTAEDATLLKSLIKGKQVSMDALASLSDSQGLKKYHKIQPEELQIGSQVDAICCRVASHELER